MSAPKFAQVLREAIAQGAAALRVSMPGRIKSFDKATQTAEVEPLIGDQIIDDAGNTKSVTLGVLSSVPVQFVGGGGFAATWPVAAGDPCLLVFADRALDDWYTSGNPSQPSETRRHHESDAVALLGVRSEPSALSEFDATRAVWGNKGPRFAADGNAVHIGVAHEESGTQDVVRGTQFTSDLSTLLDSIKSAVSSAQVALVAAGKVLTAAEAAALGYGITLTGAGASIDAAGSALGGIGSAVDAFRANASQHTTNKAKTP